MTQFSLSNKYSNFASESVTMSNYIKSHNNNILNSQKKKIWCFVTVEYLYLKKTNRQRKFVNLVINYTVIY